MKHFETLEQAELAHDEMVKDWAAEVHKKDAIAATCYDAATILNAFAAIAENNGDIKQAVLDTARIAAAALEDTYRHRNIASVDELEGHRKNLGDITSKALDFML